MEEEVVYDQIETGGDPDPLGLRKKLAATKSIKPDPLGLRAKAEASVQQEQPKAFQIQISQPKFGKTAPVTVGNREFSFEKPVDELAAVKLAGKARAATEHLDNELFYNYDIKTKMIKQRRYEEAARNIPIARSDMPKTSSQLEIDRLISKEIKPQDIPVTIDDLVKEHEDIKADRGKAVRLLEEVMKSRPEIAKGIQKSIYTIDAFNSLSQSENANDRVPKIESNAKKIDRGELIYDARSGRLIKPLGLIGSAVEGWKQKSQLFADYDFLKNTENDDAIASELEDRRTRHDPDAPIPVPKGKISEIANMLGGTPVKPLIGGAIASLGGPEAGMAAGAAIGGMEFAKLEYAANFQQVYNELRDQGVDKNEAIVEARKQAQEAAEIGAVTGAAMGLIGGRIGARPLPRLNFGSGFKQAAFNVLKTNGIELGKVGLEGLAAGGIGAAGQVYKNKLAQEAGINRPLDEGVLEQIEGNLLGTVAIGAAIKAGRGMTKANYKSLLHGLSKMPDEQVNTMLREKVANGEITQDAADQTLQRIYEYRTLDHIIPENVTEEARFKIQDKIQRRNELEQQIESTDKAYHPAIKEKIKAIDEEIFALSKETEKPPKVESGLSKPHEKEAIEIAEELLAEGILPDTYKPMIEADPIGFWKMVAQQAQNRDESWRPLKEPLEESVVREHFGDTVVDYAKELFPAPELSASTENVSVIMPGEIKQPETITISPREQPNQVSSTDKVSVIMPGERQPESINIKSIEDAVPIEIANAMDVSEAPRDGETLGRGNAQPEIVAGTQERQPEIQPQDNVESQKGVGEPRKIGITHRQMDAIAEEFGLPTYEKSPEKVKEWDEQAAKRLENPEELPKLFGKLRNGELPDAVETRMMLQYMGDLMAKIDMEPNNKDLTIQLARTKDLFNIAGRLQGKGLAARKGTISTEERLGDFLVRDMEANKAPLTDEQTAQTIKEYEEIKAAKDALDEKLAKSEAENAKLKAEKKVASEAKATKANPRKDYGSERKQIITDIKEKLRKARGETSVVAVPYAKELIAIAPDVAKLAKSYIEQGIKELPELVRHIHNVLKEDIPEITEKDVHNIIAGEYNERKPTRNQLAQQLFDLRREAKLINELEALQQGQIPSSKSKQIQRNQKIEKLKQQIKDLRDDMGLNDKTDDQKLSALKSRYKKQIKELEDKITAGDYGPDVKPDPLKLDKEAQDLKDRYNELKRHREVRLAKQEYENRKPHEKLKDFGVRVLNTPRELMASFDFSAPLRQGIVSTISHPGTAIKAFGNMFRQAFNKGEFENWLTELKESPDYATMEKSGLYVADPNNLKISAKEEQFMGSLLDHVPWLKKTIGVPVKASERAYVAYLNKMRVDLFRQGKEIFESQGRTVENSPELYEGLATYINNSTGRGGLGPLNKAAPILNTAFFSPRLIASRINLLNPYYYIKLPKEVRMMAVKDMGKMIAFGTSMLALAKLAGAEVEEDPRSSDFGKIKVGNTRWDIWGGFQQYVRLATQLYTKEVKSTTGKIYKLDGESFPYRTRLDQMASFFRGKLAPIPGTSLDALAGKNIIGEEFDPSTKASELFVPMIIQDVSDAWKDQGFKSLFTVGVPASFGVGVSTFKPK